jgi:hypothetical protein
MEQRHTLFDELTPLSLHCATLTELGAPDRLLAACYAFSFETAPDSRIVAPTCNGERWVQQMDPAVTRLDDVRVGELADAILDEHRRRPAGALVLSARCVMPTLWAGPSRRAAGSLVADLGLHRGRARALYREGLALARVHGTPRDISIYLGNLMAVERELSDATRFRAPGLERLIVRCRMIG